GGAPGSHAPSVHERRSLACEPPYGHKCDHNYRRRRYSGQPHEDLAEAPGSAAPQARIEAEGLGLACPDAFEIGVQGIEQVVQLLRNNGRGHGEHQTFRLARPAGSQVGERLRWGVAPRARWKLGWRHPGDGERLGNVGRDRDQVARRVRPLEIDEEFEGSQREARRGVDDRGARPVPGAPVTAGPLAVEGRVLGARDPPDADQLWTPYSMRPRIRSTCCAPRSVSGAANPHPLIVRLIRQAIAEKSTSRMLRNMSQARGISGNAPRRTESPTAATSPSRETATTA